MHRLKAAANHNKALEVDLRIEFAVTSVNQNAIGGVGAQIEMESMTISEPPSETSSAGGPNVPLIIRNSNNEELPSCQSVAPFDSLSTDVFKDHDEEKVLAVRDAVQIVPEFRSQKHPRLHCSQGRPNLANVIRAPVEASAGETSVVMCGGDSLTSAVRNHVAGLSDERAVRKDTGAQGIQLHVEGFGS